MGVSDKVSRAAQGRCRQLRRPDDVLPTVRSDALCIRRHHQELAPLKVLPTGGVRGSKGERGWATSPPLLDGAEHAVGLRSLKTLLWDGNHAWVLRSRLCGGQHRAISRAGTVHARKARMVTTFAKVDNTYELQIHSERLKFERIKLTCLGSAVRSTCILVLVLLTIRV